MKLDDGYFRGYDKEEIMDKRKGREYLVQSAGELLLRLIDGKGLAYIVQIGSEILGNPLILVDTSSRLLASSATVGIEDIFWRELHTIGYSQQKNLNTYEEMIQRLKYAHEPLLLEGSADDIPRRIITKISLEDKTVAYLGLIEHLRPIGDKELHEMALLQQVIASEMVGFDFAKASPLAENELVLSYLLQGRKVSRTTRDSYLERITSATTTYYVIAVHTSDSIFQSHTISHLKWVLRTILPDGISISFEQFMVILVPVIRSLSWENELSRLTKTLSEMQLTAGMSLPFQEVEAVATYYEQAKTACRIGSRLFYDQWFHDYTSVYGYELIEGLNEKELENFIYPGLEELKNYDQKQHTELYKTLTIYIETNGNMTETAERLFVHRNTAIYRIKTIEQLLGMTLDNEDFRLQLSFSFRLIHYLTKSR